MKEFSAEEKRKYYIFQNTLSVSGAGVMLLSGWNVIKIIIMMITNDSFFDELFDKLIEPDQRKVAIFMFFVLAVILVMISLYIGYSAIKEASGTDRGWRYLAVCSIVLIISIIFTIEDVVKEGMLKDIGEKLMDILSDIMSIEIIVSSIVVKIYRKKGMR